MTDYKPNEKDTELLNAGVSAFQDAGVRMGMRMILKAIDNGAALYQIKQVCEEYLK